MAIPNAEEAHRILVARWLPAGIVAHSEGVARVAKDAAQRLEAAGIPIDVGLVEAAALLHDIDKLQTRGVAGVRRGAGQPVTTSLLLAHGDDSFAIAAAVVELASELGDPDRIDLAPERSPDEALLDRARLEAASVGLFGPHLVVVHQPLRAAGRSLSGEEKLLGLVRDLPEGAALALAAERPSRECGKPPALLRRLEQGVRERGGKVVEQRAPRRAELASWTRRRAASVGYSIEERASSLLAERVGGAIWETDVERGEQTRVIDSELRKLATYAGERSIGLQ